MDDKFAISIVALVCQLVMSLDSVKEPEITRELVVLEESFQHEGQEQLKRLWQERWEKIEVRWCELRGETGRFWQERWEKKEIRWQEQREEIERFYRKQWENLEWWKHLKRLWQERRKKMEVRWQEQQGKTERLWQQRWEQMGVRWQERWEKMKVRWQEQREEIERFYQKQWEKLEWNGQEQWKEMKQLWPKISPLPLDSRRVQQLQQKQRYNPLIMGSHRHQALLDTGSKVNIISCREVAGLEESFQHERQGQWTRLSRQPLISPPEITEQQEKMEREKKKRQEEIERRELCLQILWEKIEHLSQEPPTKKVDLAIETDREQERQEKRELRLQALWERISLREKIDQSSQEPSAEELGPVGGVDDGRSSPLSLDSRRVQQLQQKQRYVSLLMDSHELHAFPDNGSELDIISYRFAKKHGLGIDATDKRQLALPNGRQIRTVGTAALQFNFQGEKDTLRRTFHVLKNSVHDVVLGRSFLETTATLTTFVHRIKTKIASLKLPHVFLLGSLSPRIRGSINGVNVNAVDDIGSDVNVMSLKEARRLGLRIEAGEAHKKLLGFADGSSAWTDGMVVGVDWRFGKNCSTTPIKIDIHILKDLTCDVILSNDFLFDNNAYSTHILSHPMDDKTEAQIEESAGFGLIMDLSDEKSMLDDLVASFRSRNPDLENGDLLFKARRELNLEVGRQLCNQERIEKLPQAQQSTAWQAEMARRQKWVDDHSLAPAPAPSGQPGNPNKPIPPTPNTAAMAIKARFGIRRIRNAFRTSGSS